MKDQKYHERTRYRGYIIIIISLTTPTTEEWALRWAHNITNIIERRDEPVGETCRRDSQGRPEKVTEMEYRASTGQ